MNERNKLPRLHNHSCRCPLHRNGHSLQRISDLLKRDHRLSPESARRLNEIALDAARQVAHE